jgi:hypothetical protein
MADQAMYHQGNQSVFVGGRLWTLLPPPANIVQNLVDTKQNHQLNKRKFYICADGPHTHTPKILVHKKTVFTFVNCSKAGVLLFKPLVDTLRFPRISIALNYLR